VSIGEPRDEPRTQRHNSTIRPDEIDKEGIKARIEEEKIIITS
jgi:hypothetical protein